MFEERKINKIKEEIETWKNNLHNQGKFSLFDAKFAQDRLESFNDLENYKYFSSMLFGWDKMCNLSYTFGKNLDKLANENAILIHRTNLMLDKNMSGIPSSEILYKIMKEGLRNLGHLSSGGYSSMPALSETTTLLENIHGYINLITPYKDNDTVILLSLPKNMVNEEGNLINSEDYEKICDVAPGYAAIKPEYILGAILKKENALDEFYSRDEIIEKYENIKLNF